MKIEEYPLPPECPYCGEKIQFTSSLQFYGRDYGTNVYYCPRCCASTTTHGDTDKPKGRLADSGLKARRRHAHALFDPMWKNKTHFKNRRKAMRWLGSVSCGHFAWMDRDEIEQVIERLQRMSAQAPAV